MWQGVTEWVKGFSVKNLCQYKKDLALLIIRKIIVTRPDSLVSTTITCSFLSVSKLLPYAKMLSIFAKQNGAEST